ncbi:Crp/Fnr family transcriptional regulator [Pedobacter miscanthi]|uniref:Crp/Fnr family transcriptional regulator n=1 Tax=Pedobacter miscanthi TaxID=2259170 RepID=UPI002930D075|nr:Crp/Fnr family transcriptional regulator [Pedobacter miscanthi]
MYQKILANFALHINLSTEEEAHVVSLLQETRIRKNQIVLREGEVCKHIYFVSEGCLRMYHTDKQGNEHNMLFMPENWWAVDIASFSGEKPAFYNISALENCRLLYLSYRVLEDLYMHNPKFERFFRILTQNGFNLYQHRITSSLSLTARERYLDFRWRYPGLELRIAQKHIASYLAITPVFLSRLRQGL